MDISDAIITSFVTFFTPKFAKTKNSLYFCTQSLARTSVEGQCDIEDLIIASAIYSENRET